MIHAWLMCNQCVVPAGGMPVVPAHWHATGEHHTIINLTPITYKE